MLETLKNNIFLILKYDMEVHCYTLNKNQKKKKKFKKEKIYYIKYIKGGGIFYVLYKCSKRQKKGNLIWKCIIMSCINVKKDKKKGKCDVL